MRNNLSLLTFIVFVGLFSLPLRSATAAVYAVSPTVSASPVRVCSALDVAQDPDPIEVECDADATFDAETGTVCIFAMECEGEDLVLTITFKEPYCFVVA